MSDADDSNGRAAPASRPSDPGDDDREAGEAASESDPGDDDREAGETESESEAGEPSRAGSHASAWLIAWFVTLSSGTAAYFAFDPVRMGKLSVLAIIGGTYGALAIAAVIWLRRRGELGQRLRPRGGDISIGALLAVGMYMLATVTYLALAARGTPRWDWLHSLYWQLGDPRLTSTFLIGISVLVIAAAEEIVWRGWVMGALVEAYTPRSGWLLSTGLYAVAHLPTVFLLADPVAGPNPLLVLAALGGGAVWGLMVLRFKRLLPSVFAHALFVWAVVEFPLLRM